MERSLRLRCAAHVLFVPQVTPDDEPRRIVGKDEALRFFPALARKGVFGAGPPLRMG